MRATDYPAFCGIPQGRDTDSHGLHRLFVVGTSHKIAPVQIREKLSLTRNAIEEVLGFLCEIEGVSGGVILSTCNRVEFYINGIAAIEKVKEFIHEYYEIKDADPYLYTYTGLDVVRHIFNVASGLDSQILGEVQILGQVRDAYRLARLDPVLNKVFTGALRVGKRVRQESGISEGNVSIGSVAIDIIKQKLNNLSNKKFLIIGVGKVSSLVVKSLSKEKVNPVRNNPDVHRDADALAHRISNGVNTVFVSNRTYEKAQELAQQIDGIAVRFDKLRGHIEDTDVIISTTNCPHVILEKKDFTKYKKPLLILDLAIPRDISPDVKELDGIELLCLDSLQEIIEENINKKKAVIPVAEKIIREELEVFHARLLELPSRV